VEGRGDEEEGVAGCRGVGPATVMSGQGTASGERECGGECTAVLEAAKTGCKQQRPERCVRCRMRDRSRPPLSEARPARARRARPESARLSAATRAAHQDGVGGDVTLEGRSHTVLACSSVRVRRGLGSVLMTGRLGLTGVDQGSENHHPRRERTAPRLC
jgi:hypothetical protein